LAFFRSISLSIPASASVLNPDKHPAGFARRILFSLQGFFEMNTADPKLLTYCGDVARLSSALAPLSEMVNWVIWRWTKNGNGKWSKPPFQSEFPSSAARNNAEATWSSHAAAA
jgi:hypothetical protein